MKVETVRQNFRPRRIKTLFVGESAPNSGKFFYFGNTGMHHYMEAVVQSVLGHSDDFLATFKSYGWYLDDLVLKPVNHLTHSERKAACLAAQSKLASRIKEYRPEAIVCLLARIEKFVESAKTIIGSKAEFYSVPFPGNGHQKRFRAEMKNILPKLPRL